MKTLLISALIASAALTGAASAQVGAGAAAAAAHFNQDIDSNNEQVAIDAAEFDGVTVSTRSGAVGEAFTHFNADYDSNNDLRGLNGATVVDANAAYGADIFARIDAESQDDE
ncbi:hypothetical protein [Jannaschia sp. 2305UL9-9]|uniref:hypothetical protein n=1 Tax=Jannaschia sp. 2305UL9-9 TaxID=3121638 RepID=UPI003529CAE1